VSGESEAPFLEGEIYDSEGSTGFGDGVSVSAFFFACFPAHGTV